MLIDSPINALKGLLIRQYLSFRFKLGCSHIIAVNVIIWLLGIRTKNIFLCKAHRRNTNYTFGQFNINFFLEKLQVPNDDPASNSGSQTQFSFAVQPNNFILMHYASLLFGLSVNYYQKSACRIYKIFLLVEDISE